MGFIAYGLAMLNLMLINIFNVNFGLGLPVNTQSPSMLASSMVQYASDVNVYVRANPGYSGSASLSQLGIAANGSCLAVCWSNSINNNMGFIYPSSSKYAPKSADVIGLGGQTLLYGSTVGTTQLISNNFGTLTLAIPAGIPTNSNVIVVQ